ncbi:MAG: hypothetical protein PHD97_04960 [Bacteroidales bacterium]|nr:hypothetical protein [Bacteroidales bacterium]
MKNAFLISVFLMFCLSINSYSQSKENYKFKLGTNYCDSTLAIQLSANELSSVTKLETTNSDYTVKSFVLSIPRGKDFDNYNSDGDKLTEIMKQKIKALSSGTTIYICLVQTVYKNTTGITSEPIDVVLPSIIVKIK